MSRIAEARPHSERGQLTTVEIEIEVHGRRDALALAELLIPFHSFLVQHDGERWAVHAHAPGCRRESLSDALAAIEEWQSARDLRAVSCRVGGRLYNLQETSAP